MEDETQKKDHDLLIEIKTIVKGLVEDVKDIKTNTVGRVEKLEIESVKRSELEAVKKDIVSLRIWRNGLIASNAIVLAVASYLAVLLIEHLTK